MSCVFNRRRRSIRARGFNDFKPCVTCSGKCLHGEATAALQRNAITFGGAANSLPYINQCSLTGMQGRLRDNKCGRNLPGALEADWYKTQRIWQRGKRRRT